MGLIPSDSIRHASCFHQLWDSVIVQPLREVNEESRAYLSSPAADGLDRKVLIILITTAFVLSFQQYLNRSSALECGAACLRAAGYESEACQVIALVEDPVNGQFHQILAWSAARFIGWLLVPALIIRFVFRERIRDYGAKISGMLRSFWLYPLMLLVVLPLVVTVSARPSFLATYPYYRLGQEEPLWPRLWCWEALHSIQFFALEFFFRGFLVLGLRHRFGSYSILVMMVPYCMIHFAKPMPEILGSIVAGLVLGFMSLKTRSIWMGTALHATVAFSMDMLALHQHGRLG
jgi:membrane protease YdiL (CAAX protease family)